MTRRLTPFVFLCVMGGLAIFSTTMSKNPALPLFVASMGVDEGTLGLIAAAATVVGVVVSLPAGILSDLLGRRRMILLSMVVFATAPFLYLVVSTPGQLVFVRIYHGLATAILGPVAMAAVADTYEAGRGERMAWYSSATLVGRFIAPTAGGLLIVGQDFRWVYLGAGIAGVLALAAAIRWQAAGGTSAEPPVRPAGARPDGGRLLHELRAVLSNRHILMTSLMEASLYFGYGGMEIFLPLYLTALGYAPWEIGPLFTAQVVVTALSKPALGRLSDQWGRKRFIGAGLLSAAAVLALMPQTSNYWALGALTSAFGLCVAAVTASTAALVSDLSRAGSYGSALGAMSSIMDVGHASGPVATGFLVLRFGYGPAFATVAGVLVVGAAAFMMVVTDPRRATAAI